MARRQGRNIGRASVDGESPKELDDLQERPSSPTQPPIEPIEDDTLDDNRETDSDGIIPDLGGRNRNENTESQQEEEPILSDFPNNSEISEAPTYELEEDHLANVDISQRSGNYLLSIGPPRSGKTVLQSFMTYYMDIGGTLSANLDIKEPNGTINNEAQRLKTIWLESWTRGTLPKSTPVGEDKIRELRLNVVNQENKSQKFNFSFLEVSGENFLDMVPNEEQNSTLFERLKSFLSNKKIKMNLAFVLKHDEEENIPSCDALFTNFIEFVTNQLDLKIKNRAGLILVLPNTKAVFGKEDWEKSRRDARFYDRTMKDYIYGNFPATYKIFDNWKKSNRAIISFHIGDVEDDVLTNKDYQDVKAFIGLNYKMFTGKKLAPKFSFLRSLMGG